MHFAFLLKLKRIICLWLTDTEEHRNPDYSLRDYAETIMNSFRVSESPKLRVFESQSLRVFESGLSTRHAFHVTNWRTPPNLRKLSPQRIRKLTTVVSVFLCDDGESINADSFCDSSRDCKDGSDELSAAEISGFHRNKIKWVFRCDSFELNSNEKETSVFLHEVNTIFDGDRKQQTKE